MKKNAGHLVYPYMDHIKMPPINTLFEHYIHSTCHLSHVADLVV